MGDCQKFSPKFLENHHLGSMFFVGMTTFIHKLHQEEALAALASAEDHGWLPTVEIDTDFKHLRTEPLQEHAAKVAAKMEVLGSPGG